MEKELATSRDIVVESAELFDDVKSIMKLVNLTIGRKNVAIAGADSIVQALAGISLYLAC